jgi:hypothetical protein
MDIFCGRCMTIVCDSIEECCVAVFAYLNGSNNRSLISLGGGTAVAKVRTKWGDDNNVQTPLRKFANLFAAEMKAWADDE